MVKNDVIQTAKDAFRKHFSHEPECTVPAPGRTNIIGEHTDYNDGHVLPIAIDRFTVAAASRRQDRKFKLVTDNLKETFEFDLDRIPGTMPHWVAYIMGVIVETDALHTLAGKNICVFGNVPIGSGLSSSAALEICVATALERLEGLKLSDGDMVNICRRGDHRFIGVKCGPMDQFASRACRAGFAGLLDCRSLVMTHHPLPDNLLYLSIFSGIPRALAASEYNERFHSCQKAAEILRKGNPDIAALRDATLEEVEANKKKLGSTIYKRALHVVTEQARVFQMIDAFQTNNMKNAGEILLQGHYSLSRDYEVSLPVLDEMVHWLYNHGAVGGRLTGAGFGGSLICLIEKDTLDPEKFAGDFVQTFRKKTPELPEMWTLTSVEGARYQSEK
jgi:galactokinase